MPPATRQLDQVPGWGSGTSGVVARVMLLIDVLPLSTLHQLDADAVGRGDIAQQTAAEALLQFDRKFHALRAQFGAEGREVNFIQKAEMIGAEPVMAGKSVIRPDRPSRPRVFARPLAADQDVHAAKFDENLWHEHPDPRQADQDVHAAKFDENLWRAIRNRIARHRFSSNLAA